MSKPTTPSATPRRKGVKHWLREGAIILVMWIAISSAVDFWRTQDMPEAMLPNTTLQTIDGELVDLIAMSQDHPVLIYFWATWCGACRFVTPTVDWISDHYPVVSIALTSGESRRLKAYLNSHDYSFRVVNDHQGQQGRAWGINATPTIVVLKNGQVQSATTGITTPPGLWLRLLLNE
ncbi:protein disulfide oxidoreductase [Photobacterium atrarenae]|uniref:Protein disulfide oxidoreductase n=1 Tax=Photobacterium atrarenae TaxID=865757 RepID=A0ABY5GKL1_9GAMM|nr:protein disulfide oxidoreductase [Photobacterium atrarenae]UTV29777.1 protein disulfide oxidoreductase [Photobacterium atrarenae]